jgi:hypothetical protein
MKDILKFEMNIKIKLIAIVLLFSTNIFSQEFSQENIGMPKMTPPSPEAFALTKYGDVPVNEFSGMVNSTIPIYTYKVGNLELPISLNYTGAGVKVDDIPTWVGINWTLNAGGVITRTLKDDPDETVGNSNRVMLSDQQVTDYSHNLLNGSTNAQILGGIIDNTAKDTEVDIFNFNFLGYSGSFYFDGNFKGIVRKKDQELQIGVLEPFNTTKTIIITTPDGIKFTFGGEGAIEDTELRYIRSASLQNVNAQGTTAFYLKKIEHPIRGEIVFDYSQSSTIQNIQLTKEQTKNSVAAWYNGFGSEEVAVCCMNNPTISQSVQTTTVSNRIYNPVKLTKIRSTMLNEMVEFSSSTVDNASFKNVLNSIQIINNGNLIKKVDFEYTPFTTNPNPQGYGDITKRFFLKKVTFDNNNDIAQNGSDGRRNEVYEFEYNNENLLPARFSYAQDYIGYYNGKDNNPNLLPNNQIFNPHNVYGYADRNANFEFASLGALTDIYYPTGGHTHFEYEAPKSRKKNYSGVNLYAYRNQQNRVEPNQLSDGVPRALSTLVDLDGDGEYDLITEFDNPIPEDQIITVTVNMEALHTNEFPTFFPNQEMVTLNVYNVTEGHGVLNRDIKMDALDQFAPEGLYYHTKSYSFEAEHGDKYEISIDIAPSEGNDRAVPLEVYASFGYSDGYLPIDDVGVRVKKIINYTSDSIVANTKRFYYAPIDRHVTPNNELPEVGNRFRITTDIVNYICMSNSSCGLGFMGATEFVKQYSTLHSDSFNNFFQTSGINAFPIVTTSFGGDNFENGGVEKTFSIHEDVSASQFDTKAISPQINFDDAVSVPEIIIPTVLNGQLLKEKVYVKKDNFLKKLKETEYDYDTDIIQHVNNITASELYTVFFYLEGMNTSNVLSGYYIGNYKINSHKCEPTFKQVTEYITPVPLGVEDESSYQKMITTQEYDYGDLRGLPTYVTSSTSIPGTDKITRNYYPNEAVNFDVAGENLNGYIKLKDQNRVATPVQVESYLGGQLLSKQRTLYKAWNDIADHVLPEKIQTAKGENELEDRIVYTEYNVHGNPMEVSLVNGSKTRYYYNNNNQVMVKIENYIEPEGGTGGVLTGNEPFESDDNGCDLHLAYPKSLVTTYSYNSMNLLTQITDHNCRNTYYEYDGLHNLKYIKDHNGNVLKEFDANYRRY